MSIGLVDFVYLVGMVLWFNSLVEALCSCITNITSGPEKTLIFKNIEKHCTILKASQRILQGSFPLRFNT